MDNTQTQNITKQHAYRVAKKFKNHEPEFKNCGRKPKQITDEERNIVIQTYKEIRASYERKHSNILWHTDWFEYKGKQCIIYIGDGCIKIYSKPWRI